MRVLLVLTLCAVVVGLSRGWFMLSGPHRNSDGNKIDIQLTVDPSMVRSDAAYVTSKATELLARIMGNEASQG
jgi:hypothetical protein